MRYPQKKLSYHLLIDHRICYTLGSGNGCPLEKGGDAYVCYI